jgi:hypothetical protein
MCALVLVMYSHTSFKIMNHPFYKTRLSEVTTPLWGVVAFSLVRTMHELLPGFSLTEKRLMSSPKRSDKTWGPKNLLLNWYHGIFPWRILAGAWSWQRTLSSADVKYEWRHTFTARCHFMAWTWATLTLLCSLTELTPNRGMPLQICRSLNNCS